MPYHVDTLGVHAGHGSARDPYGSHAAPLYQTSTFVLDSARAGAAAFAGEGEGTGHVYSRLGNPTVEALEEALAAWEGRGTGEGAHALAFGSGMAAISTVLLATAAGRRVVAQEALYGCTTELLAEQAPRLGITVDFVDAADPRAVQGALRRGEPPALLFLESPANPTMAVCDIRALAEMARERGTLVAVDNTFATPYHQRPLALGADVVVHSTTKYAGGHGTAIGGAAVVRDPALRDRIAGWRKNLGGIAGPFDAWLVMNGLRTLALRMERHASNAQRVAEWLEPHPAVARVWYPGLASHPQHAVARRQMEHGYGGVLSFELAGGYAAGVRMMDAVKLCTLAVSLGTVDTLIQHPASMTHAVVAPEMREKAGITDGLVRLSVGIEDADDVIADLEQALRAAGPDARRVLGRAA